MKPRLDYWNVEPELLQRILDADDAITQAGLEPGLIHLVKLRASQINGCAYCTDLHSYEARRDGDGEQRVHLVAAWRESPLFSDRERAALAWTERLTRLADDIVEDEDYDVLAAHFTPSEIVQLTMVIGVINTLNRLAVPFRNIHPVRRQKKAA